MTRHDGRAANQLRTVDIQPGFQRHPLGSVLIRMGNTHVICAASVEERVPGFLAGAGEGWVTAEYSMLPSSTGSRVGREVTKGRASGRTMEIQRLIGRSMRSVVDRAALGERTIWLDCDVIQADGGTRTASITGAFVAMALAADQLYEQEKITAPLFSAQVAAISVGIVGGTPVLDLDYVEDSSADTDMNVVSTERGGYIEVQGTAEGAPFPRAQLDALLRLADEGIGRLAEIQREILGDKLGRLLTADAAGGK